MEFISGSDYCGLVYESLANYSGLCKHTKKLLFSDGNGRLNKSLVNASRLRKDFSKI